MDQAACEFDIRSFVPALEAASGLAAHGDRTAALAAARSVMEEIRAGARSGPAAGEAPATWFGVEVADGPEQDVCCVCCDEARNASIRAVWRGSRLLSLSIAGADWAVCQAETSEGVIAARTGEDLALDAEGERQLDDTVKELDSAARQWTAEHLPAPVWWCPWCSWPNSSQSTVCELCELSAALEGPPV